MSESMEMPKYQCLKKVWALRIKEIVQNPNESMDVFFEEDGFAPRNFEKHDRMSRPEPSAGWYMVIYPDGYVSFSPASAFETGYRLIAE